MNNLRDLYSTIDRLNRDEKRQLRAYIDQQLTQPQITDEDVQTKIAALHAAVENFWEGIPQEKIDEIVEEMNVEYVQPMSEDDWFEGKDER